MPITLGNVLLPVTVRLVNVGVSDTVMVAIPLGCAFANAVILPPRKSRV